MEMETLTSSWARIQATATISSLETDTAICRPLTMWMRGPMILAARFSVTSIAMERSILSLPRIQTTRYVSSTGMGMERSWQTLVSERYLRPARSLPLTSITMAILISEFEGMVPQARTA